MLTCGDSRWWFLFLWTLWHNVHWWHWAHRAALPLSGTESSAGCHGDLLRVVPQVAVRRMVKDIDVKLRIWICAKYIKTILTTNGETYNQIKFTWQQCVISTFCRYSVCMPFLVLIYKVRIFDCPTRLKETMGTMTFSACIASRYVWDSKPTHMDFLFLENTMASFPNLIEPDLNPLP